MADQNYTIHLKVLEEIKGLKRTQQEVDRTTKAFLNLGTQIKAGIAGGLGFGVAGSIQRSLQAIKQLPGEIIKANIEFEKNMKLLQTTFQDAERAGQAWDHLREKADRYGQSIQTLAFGYSRMQIAARESGQLSEQGADDLTEGILTAATALQLDRPTVDGVIRAFEQITSKGKILSEELHQQLGDRLPGAVGIFASAIGVGTAEMAKLLESGTLAADVNLPKVAARLKEAFGPGAIAGAKTLRAELNRLDNALFELKVAGGQSGFIEGFTEGVKNLAEVLKDPDIKDGMRGLGVLMGQATEGANLFNDIKEGIMLAVPGLQSLVRLGQDNESVTERQIQVMQAFKTQQQEALAGYQKLLNAEGDAEAIEYYLIQMNLLANTIAGADAALAELQDKMELSTDITVTTTAAPDQEESQLLRLVRIRSAMARLEEDSQTAALAKRPQMVALLLEEGAAIEKVNAGLEQQAELEKDADKKIKILAEVEENYLRQAEILDHLTQLTTSGEFQAGIVAWYDEFGSIGDQVADVVTGTLDGAFQGLSDSIYGLINGTMTWGQAVDNVLLSIGQSLLRTTADFVAQQAVMFAVRQLFGKAFLASAMAEATLFGQIWATPAFFASVATFGGATAAGLTSLAAGTAAAQGIALAGQGFQAGGWTGSGSDDEVAGPAHRNEVIMEAPVVRRVGLQNLLNLRAGRIGLNTGSAPGRRLEAPSVPSSSARIDDRAIHVYEVKDKFEARRIRDNQANGNWFRKQMKANGVVTR